MPRSDDGHGAGIGDVVVLQLIVGTALQVDARDAGLAVSVVGVGHVEHIVDDADAFGRRTDGVFLSHGVLHRVDGGHDAVGS